MKGMTLIVYRILGIWHFTPEENYNAYVQDARKVHPIPWADTATEVVNYMKKYICHDGDTVVVKGE